MHGKLRALAVGVGIGVAEVSESHRGRGDGERVQEDLAGDARPRVPNAHVAARGAEQRIGSG